jgi:hypothetical protein
LWNQLTTGIVLFDSGRNQFTAQEREMILTNQKRNRWFGILGTLCFVASVSVGLAAADDAPALPNSGPAKQVAAEAVTDAGIIRTIETQLTDPDDVFLPTALHLQQPDVGRVQIPRILSNQVQSSAASQRIATRLFGRAGRGRSLLSANRRRFSGQPGTVVVLGSESRLRLSTDAGDLLKKSPSALGVGGQRRSPIMTDTRIRGGRIGSLLASGSYYFPARQDLDTLMSKIDSRIVEDMIIIKGPYASRYGPGHTFVDFALKQSPRYANGPESHATTSFDYGTNGERFYGRQTFTGGAENYGFRVGYGHKGGVDFESGDGNRIPGSYKSRDFDVALGIDLDEYSSLEFSYLRLDQTDTEVATQIF